MGLIRFRKIWCQFYWHKHFDEEEAQRVIDSPTGVGEGRLADAGGTIGSKSYDGDLVAHVVIDSQTSGIGSRNAGGPLGKAKSKQVFFKDKPCKWYPEGEGKFGLVGKFCHAVTMVVIPVICRPHLILLMSLALIGKMFSLSKQFMH